MSNNPVQCKWTKLIYARHYFLRDNIEKKVIYMKFYKTKKQVVDIFIKTLHKKQFVKNRLRLGLIKMN